MKLEALNGNILPILKMQEDDTSATEALEANDDEELPEVMDEEEAADGKKKKQTRKKRSLNWEEAERGLLLEVIKPKVDYVENRNVDAKSIKAKRLAWLQITKQFNALNFRHRSLEQIQVQWRSMKNTAKREYQNKHPKSPIADGHELLDFMEEMQKEPVATRSQTRAPTAGVVAALLAAKKDELENDLDEDTPLAALPTANDESSSLHTQASALTLPSPPHSAESQCDSQQHHAMPMRNNNNNNNNNGNNTNSNNTTTTNKRKNAALKLQQALPQAAVTTKPKRQRSQNVSVQSLDLQLTPTTTTALLSAATNAVGAVAAAADETYKKDLFELLKRARLAEMDYVRREHEQKLRLHQMEQDLKLSYYRKHEELKLQQQREEHETRMRHLKLEHEARIRAYGSGVMKTAAADRSVKKEILNSNNNASADVVVGGGAGESATSN